MTSISHRLQPYRFVLLTGAGFSYPFGGLLATEFSAQLIRCVSDRRRIRDLLLDSQSFEEALGRVRSQTDYDEGDKSALESAILEVFLGMDRDQRNRQYRDGEVNVYGFERFLQLFQCPFGGNANAGFIFTLNQDLLLEHRWINFDPRGFPIAFPGIPQLRWESQLELYEVSLNNDLSVQYQQQTNIVKLHGSINWRTSDRARALVIGTAKTQMIEAIPILSNYVVQFQKVLQSPNVKLMIIGYSFRDEHINQALLEGANSGLDIHVWDPNAVEILRCLRKHEKYAGIAAQVSGTYVRKMHEVFPAGDRRETSEWLDIKERFFEIPKPPLQAGLPY